MLTLNNEYTLDDRIKKKRALQTLGIKIRPPNTKEKKGREKEEEAVL